MSGLKLGIALVLTCVLLMTLAVPVLAVDYVPGVSVGQGADYGNYLMDGEQGAENWTRIGVTAVSGSEVTITVYTAKMDGTDETVEKVYDVEAGTVDGQPAEFPGAWIIAGNLNEGDALPPVDKGYIINTTETRTYLDVSRSVNVVSYEYTDADAGYTISETYVYDQASGIMLEMEGETSGAYVSEYSYSITFTDIFGETEATPTPSEGIPVEYIYVGVIVVVIVIVVIAIALKKRSK
jgi:hypothetical protein